LVFCGSARQRQNSQSERMAGCANLMLLRVDAESTEPTLISTQALQVFQAIPPVLDLAPHSLGRRSGSIAKGKASKCAVRITETLPITLGCSECRSQLNHGCFRISIPQHPINSPELSAKQRVNRFDVLRQAVLALHGVCGVQAWHGSRILRPCWSDEADRGGKQEGGLHDQACLLKKNQVLPVAACCRDHSRAARALARMGCISRAVDRWLRPRGRCKGQQRRGIWHSYCQSVFSRRSPVVSAVLEAIDGPQPARAASAVEQRGVSIRPAGAMRQPRAMRRQRTGRARTV